MAFNSNVICWDQIKEQISVPTEPSQESNTLIEELKKCSSYEILRFLEKNSDAQILVEETVNNLLQGCTHYTHVLQDLTGNVHYKVQSLEYKDENHHLSYKALTQGEIDASSLPTGGLVSTDKAKGITRWNPTAPILVRDAVAYIPCTVARPNGSAIDCVSGLIRALEQLNIQVVALCNKLGIEATSTEMLLGIEQEFFLVEKNLADQRPDLINCERALFGAIPPNNQQFSNRYFGPMPQRTEGFFKELQEKCAKLVFFILVKHREVAPNQFEVVLRFTKASAAIYQNQILRILIQEIAGNHGLKALFHAKPFLGVNGSGQHCNYSIQVQTKEKSINGFSPGTTKEENLLFLTLITCLIEGMYWNYDLLQASIMTPGNEQRLGEDEAPNSIMCFDPGKWLAILEEFMEDGTLPKDQQPQEPVHDDRNRTVPMAETGGKIEFRSPEASQNVSLPIMTIATILASTIKDFLDEIEKREVNKEGDIDWIHHYVLARRFKLGKEIIFSGNAYSDAWKDEADIIRSLNTSKNTLDALTNYNDPWDDHSLFENVLSYQELNALVATRKDEYVKTIDVEVKTLQLIWHHHIKEHVCVWNKHGLFGSLLRGNLPLSWQVSRLSDCPIQNVRDEMIKIKDRIDELDQTTPSHTWGIPSIREILKPL